MATEFLDVEPALVVDDLEAELSSVFKVMASRMYERAASTVNRRL